MVNKPNRVDGNPRVGSAVSMRKSTGSIMLVSGFICCEPRKARIVSDATRHALSTASRCTAPNTLRIFNNSSVALRARSEGSIVVNYTVGFVCPRPNIVIVDDDFWIFGGAMASERELQEARSEKANEAQFSSHRRRPLPEVASATVLSPRTCATSRSASQALRKAWRRSNCRLLA
jgi:hypothetical protein